MSDSSARVVAPRTPVDVRASARAFLWSVRIGVMSLVRYRFDIASETAVFGAVLAVMMISGSGAALTRDHPGLDGRSVVLTGYLAWTFATTALNASVSDLTSELASGMFYRKLKARCPLILLQLGNLLSTFIVNMVTIIILAALAAVVWGVHLSVTASAIIGIVLSTFGMFGMGLVIGGFAIRYKRVGALLLIVQAGLLFVTDTVSANPAVERVTALIPLTWCGDIIRADALGDPTATSLLVLAALSCAWFVAGAVCFRVFLNRARRKGNLLWC